MQLEHEFTVPVPVAQAWDVLLDVERIAPCMPGATVESFDGETIEGRVKVKVGPIQVTYAGTARFVEKDEAGRRAVIDASAKEARGSGTAKATITTVLKDEGGTATKVVVTTDLAITGKPAQFGRGVMVEVGNKILGRFADCLAGELGSDSLGPAAGSATEPAAGAAAATPAAGAGQQTAGAGQQTAGAGQEDAGATDAAASMTAAPPQATPAHPAAHPPLRRVPDDDAIDLLDTVGLPLLKRLAPVLGVVLLLVLWRLIVRRRG